MTAQESEDWGIGRRRFSQMNADELAAKKHIRRKVESRSEAGFPTIFPSQNAEKLWERFKRLAHKFGFFSSCVYVSCSLLDSDEHRSNENMH